jgi:hypothetical protein
MRTDKLNNKHILADEGKVLRRISDGQLFGNEIYLGYTYYLAEEKLEEPLLELPEHYEEIDDPAEEETTLIDEDTPLEEEPEYTLFSDNEGPEVIEITEREKVTVADFRRLEKQVELLMQMIGGAE